MSSLITARTLMSIAVHNGLPIHHADIAQAFVQAKLDRSIFCSFPKGVDVSAKLIDHLQSKHPNSRIGIRLLKSLYGLKNAPLYWSIMLNEHLCGLGFERSKSDTCLYVHRNEKSGKWCAIAVFVDDLLVTGTDTDKISELREYLSTTFQGNGAWEENINSFLGMNIFYDQVNGILKMDIASKIDDLFKNHPEISSVHGINAPHLACFDKLDLDEPSSLSSVEQYIKDNFSVLAGTFIYLTITCRPDLTTIVNKACKGMHDPQYRHIAYMLAAIKYVKNHRTLGLCYERDRGGISNVVATLAERYEELKNLQNAPVVAFSDASHLGLQKDKMRSVSGSAIYCHDHLIEWSAKCRQLLQVLQWKVNSLLHPQQLTKPFGIII
mmetsp:Transcript_31412/g.97185  ORF Transcript_31412/g.97185 Transcript_31412/m.97185 type:complete len:381 (-) Transcript_31412:5203-6345(-)